MQSISYFMVTLFYVSVVGVIGALLAYSSSSKSQKIYLLFVTFTSISVLFLRDVLAPADALAYKSLYYDVHKFTDIFGVYHKEFFFSFTNYLGRMVGLEFENFSHVFVSLLILLSAYSIYKIGKEKIGLLALSMFLTSSSFILLFTNGMRQGLASTLMLLSIYYLTERRYLTFAIISLLALLSHKSSFLVYFLALSVHLLFMLLNSRKDKFRLWSLVMVAVVGAIGAYGINEIWGISKFEQYQEREYNSATRGYIRIALLYIPYLYFLYLARKSQNKMSKCIEAVALFYLSSLIAATVFIEAPMFASRMAYYASFLCPLFFCLIIYELEVKNRRLIFQTLPMFIFCYGLFALNFQSVKLQLLEWVG